MSERTCAGCGVSLDHRRGDAMYCSKSCRAKLLKPKKPSRTLKCALCETVFEARVSHARFCTPRCRERWNRGSRKGDVSEPKTLTT